MKIYYIPAVASRVSELPAKVAPVLPKQQAVVTEEEMGWVQEQVYNAFNQIKLDIGFWLNEQWIKFVDASFILCLAIAFMGAICGVLGIKRGYKVTVLSIVFYLFLKMFSYLMGWY